MVGGALQLLPALQVRLPALGPVQPVSLIPIPILPIVQVLQGDVNGEVVLLEDGWERPEALVLVQVITQNRVVAWLRRPGSVRARVVGGG